VTEPLPREIWDRTFDEGARRMGRDWKGQASTGLIGGSDVIVGLFIAATITGAVATVTNEEVAHAVGSLGFGIAFVMLTIGRSELFTENFLVPVGAWLAGRGSGAALARMWSLTFLFNLIGATMLAAIVSVHGVLPASAYDAIGTLGDTFATRDYGQAFASAIVAGATMTVYTWMTMAVRTDTARILLAMIIGFVLLLPALNHVIVGFGELILAVISGSASPGLGESALHVIVALAGNLIGGIGFVTLTRLVQVSGEPHDPSHGRGEADAPAASERV
jgi:formate/nitrite transporter FocA (FNT family)